MTDIVERLRGELGWGIGPSRFVEEVADEIERLRSILEDRHMAEMVKDAEIERLREEAGYAKLMYDKHMAEKLTRAEEVIEAARIGLDWMVHCLDRQSSEADRLNLEADIDRLREALATYDKEGGDD